MVKSISESIRETLEILEQLQSLKLPPIPSGYLRLTHFTSRSPQIISNNDTFKVQHMLNSTTDPFSNNQDVLDLIVSGKTGAMTRSGFGNTVLLMDLTFDEHKRLSSKQIPISNSRILGYVDRNTMIFHRNPNYNPHSLQELPPIRQLTPAFKDTQGPTPQPLPSTSQSNQDVF